MRPANKWRCYIVTPFHFGLANTQNDPCFSVEEHYNMQIPRKDINT